MVGNEGAMPQVEVEMVGGIKKTVSSLKYFLINSVQMEVPEVISKFDCVRD